MKKIIALLMALTLVFAFAACGGKEEDTTTATTTDLFAEDETTLADEETTVAVDATTVEGETTTAATDVTTATGETTVAGETTTASANGLNSTDVAAVVAYYNAAVIKTNKEGAPKGQSTMKLDGKITGDGALGGVLKVASPIIESTLEKNSTATDYIPGKGQLKPEDVIRAEAVSKNGVTTIKMTVKEQTDGAEADAHTAGPVARAVGTLGNINNAIESLGAELYSGRDTIKLTYKSCTINAKINETTGKITGGTWHYSVNIFVGDAEIKLVIKFNAKNLKGIVDYTVTI